MLGTNVGRVELREGLETMSLSRFQRQTDTAAGVVFVSLRPVAVTVLSALSAAVLVVLTLFSATLTPLAAAQSDDRTIRADGVGDAVLGLTAEELADSLGDNYAIGTEIRITVDFDGRVITSGGEVQFRAAMTDNTDQLNLFIVSNPEYATVEGVGPTTTIADAEAVYGEATLSWNPDDEGREFVSFENGPEGRILFRTPGIGGNNVGVYADGEFETTDYEDDAVIAAVWVSCVSGTDCPADLADAQPTATPEPEAEPTATPDPEPEPTATPAPEPTATPEPEPTPAPEADDADAGAGGQLPQTGSTELVLLALVSLLLLVGGALVVVERQYLCPAWLSNRK